MGVLQASVTTSDVIMLDIRAEVCRPEMGRLQVYQVGTVGILLAQDAQGAQALIPLKCHLGISCITQAWVSHIAPARGFTA